MLRYKDIISRTSTTEEAIQFAKELGLMSSSMECDKCDRQLSFVKKSAYTDGYIWKCPTKRCSREKSIH
jgi:hypothetical protein